MNIGMLWFDNDVKAGLAARVERAARYYQNKYGAMPTLCFVHPSMLASQNGAKDSVPAEPEGEKVLRSGGVEIRSNRMVLPNHIWIGVNAQVSAQPAGL